MGRPDRICIEFYDDDSYVDYLLKFNNISDPFSIDYLDVIKIPVLTDDWKALERPSSATENIVRQEFTDKKKLSTKDQKRVDFLKKKYGIKEVLPPNVLKTGFKTFKFIKVNGESATVMGAAAQNPESNAKKISKSKKAKVNDSIKADPELSKIASKSVSELTDSEIAILANKGISVSDLQNIDKENKEAGIVTPQGDSESKSTVYKKLDENGNYIGSESLVESKVLDSDKMTTTVTKTLIKPDGTMETTQYTTFTKASEFGESILENKPIVDTSSSNTGSRENSSEVQETEQSLEDKLSKNLDSESENRRD
jgi:hypothetical protein